MSRPLCVPCSAPCLVREAGPHRPRPLDALLIRAQQGDARAFQRMRRRFEPALVNFVRSYVRGDDDTAFDVVQETFTVAWHKIDQIRDGEHLKPWLYRVARFKAITFLRRRGPKGRAMHSLDYAADNGADYPDPSLQDPLRMAMTREATSPWLAALRAAIGRLPPLYVPVLRLYHLEGLSTKEVAAMLGLSLTTVKMRLMRGRAHLRRLVLEEMDGEEPDL
ncbi:MAG: RNA polymerase sigma factor [Planctomycetota bacterium]|nr:RNA polymerase sigma factor [Planctomycetota bacterium]